MEHQCLLPNATSRCCSPHSNTAVHGHLSCGRDSGSAGASILQAHAASLAWHLVSTQCQGWTVETLLLPPWFQKDASKEPWGPGRDLSRDRLLQRAHSRVMFRELSDRYDPQNAKPACKSLRLLPTAHENCGSKTVGLSESWRSTPGLVCLDGGTWNQGRLFWSLKS